MTNGRTQEELKRSESEVSFAKKQFLIIMDSGTEFYPLQRGMLVFLLLEYRRILAYHSCVRAKVPFCRIHKYARLVAF